MRAQPTHVRGLASAGCVLTIILLLKSIGASTLFQSTLFLTNLTLYILFKLIRKHSFVQLRKAFRKLELKSICSSKLKYDLPLINERSHTMSRVALPNSLFLEKDITIEREL